MQNSFHTLAAFCGSADGLDPVYVDAARATGQLLAELKITLVYGAGRTGMMGELAREFLQKGGKCIGVAPKGLESPQLVYTTELSRFELVENIQQRKARMAELAEGFIALPGGFGTLDELSEILTWSQIGLHRKPMGILNVNGYYDDLLRWINRACRDHFLYEEHLDLFVTASTPETLLEKMSAFRFPDKIERWLER